MKPTSLRPGDRLVARDQGAQAIVWTFVRRVPRRPGRPAHCVLQSDACRGLNGPDDEGLAEASDHDIARRFELAPNGRAPAPRVRDDTPTDLLRLRDEYVTRGYASSKSVARDAQLIVELIDRVARAEAALRKTRN